MVRKWIVLTLGGWPGLSGYAYACVEKSATAKHQGPEFEAAADLIIAKAKEAAQRPMRRVDAVDVWGPDRQRPV